MSIQLTSHSEGSDLKFHQMKKAFHDSPGQDLHFLEINNIILGRIWAW